MRSCAATSSIPQPDALQSGAGGDPNGWWNVCNWDSTENPYGVSIFSTRRTVGERRTNPNSVFLRDVTVGASRGIVTTKRADPDELTCYVSIPAKQGMVELGITWLYGERHTMLEAPPCAVAVQHMTYFEPGPVVNARWGRSPAQQSGAGCAPSAAVISRQLVGGGQAGPPG